MDERSVMAGKSYFGKEIAYPTNQQGFRIFSHTAPFSGLFFEIALTNGHCPDDLVLSFFSFVFEFVLLEM